MAIAVAANMRQDISLAKIALLAAYSYGYHGKSEKNKRKREEKLRKGKESEEKREEKLRKGKESERKREEKLRKGKNSSHSTPWTIGMMVHGSPYEKRSALSSLQKTKRSAYGLVAQGLNPLQPAYFDILALAFSTSSSLGRGSFLASITTWKTKSVTHFCEKPRRWLY